MDIEEYERKANQQPKSTNFYKKQNKDLTAKQ